MQVVRFTGTEIKKIVVDHLTKSDGRLGESFPSLIEFKPIELEELIENTHLLTGEVRVERRDGRSIQNLERLIRNHLRDSGYEGIGEFRYYYQLSDDQIKDIRSLYGVQKGDFVLHVVTEGRRKFRFWGKLFD